MYAAEATAEGPSYTEALETGRPVSSQIGRLVLEHHLQPPLGDLRLVGGVGGEELRALHQHVDKRRHVVVVHPRPQEAELLLGADVARGQLAQVRVHLLLGQPGGSSRARRRRTASGIWRSNSSSTEETPIAASIAARSSGVVEV